MRQGSTIIISGAGIAGLVAACWLGERGFRPVVVERSRSLRATGHAVDLWGSPLEILGRMGLSGQLAELSIRNHVGITVTGNGRRAEVPLSTLSASIHPEHVEIMRSHLVTLLADAADAHAEWMFGREIVAVEQDADGAMVTLDDGSKREASLVIGADGVHSAVGRLVFGDDRQVLPLGARFGNWSMPNRLNLDGTIVRYLAPGRTMVAFPVPRSDRLAVIALERTSASGDPSASIDDIRQAFTDQAWPVPLLTAGLDEADDFYGDTIVRVRTRTPVRGRVALIGDAAFAPGAAVGGGTGLAVLSAYLLATAVSEGETSRALPAYAAAMQPLVAKTERIAPELLDALLPRSTLAASLTVRLLPVLAGLPGWLRQRVPILPRPALEGLRAIAGYPIGPADTPIMPTSH